MTILVDEAFVKKDEKKHSVWYVTKSGESPARTMSIYLPKQCMKGESHPEEIRVTVSAFTNG